MLNRYKKYDRSFMEVILEVAGQKVDFTMESPVFEYLIDHSYALHYLHHPSPNSTEMDRLLTLLEPVTAPDDTLILVKLPIPGPLLDIHSPVEQYNKLVNTMYPDIATRRRNDVPYYLNTFAYDPFSNYPLLFANFAELNQFLMSDDESVRLLLFSHLLLLPTKMDWLVWFDDYMLMLHLMAKPALMEVLKTDANFERLRKE